MTIKEDRDGIPDPSSFHTRGFCLIFDFFKYTFLFDRSQINRFVKCKRQIWKMMTKKMSLLLTGMLLCLAPDIKGNETDGRIKGIVMEGDLGGPLEFVTVQVKDKG